jgi:hypothetical protein
MSQLKKGTKVLVKGRRGIHEVSTGWITTGDRIRVNPFVGKSFQVAVSSVKCLTDSELDIITWYEHVISWPSAL